MKNSFKKFKKGPLISAFIFLIASVAVFVLLQKEINKNYQTSKDRETELAAEALKKTETKSFEQILKTVESERALLDKHFIKNSDVALFLDVIENLAPQVKATAEVTEVAVAPDNTSMTVGLKADGSFEALYKFIKLLENSPYQLEIYSMSMQRIGASAESTVVEEGGEVKEVVKWSAVFKIKLLSFIP
jgi:hypothetical protein